MKWIFTHLWETPSNEGSAHYWVGWGTADAKVGKVLSIE